MLFQSEQLDYDRVRKLDFDRVWEHLSLNGLKSFDKDINFVMINMYLDQKEDR